MQIPSIVGVQEAKGVNDSSDKEHAVKPAEKKKINEKGGKKGKAASDTSKGRNFQNVLCFGMSVLPFLLGMFLLSTLFV